VSDAIIFGGQAFRPVRRGPISQDLYMLQAARRGGLHDLRLEAGETYEGFAARLLDTLLSSGVAVELLAGLLVPDSLPDGEWTPELAAGTARTLNQITNEAEKERFRLAVVELLTGFFASALTSSNGSGGASVAGRGQRAGEKTRKPRPTGSENGGRWSGILRRMTSPDTPRSSSGRWRKLWKVSRRG
jgi:hypothetical protein